MSNTAILLNKRHCLLYNLAQFWLCCIFTAKSTINLTSLHKYYCYDLDKTPKLNEHLNEVTH